MSVDSGVKFLDLIILYNSQPSGVVNLEPLKALFLKSPPWNEFAA